MNVGGHNTFSNLPPAIRLHQTRHLQRTQNTDAGGFRGTMALAPQDVLYMGVLINHQTWGHLLSIHYIQEFVLLCSRVVEQVF